MTTDQRRYIKAVNFGLIYGMSAFGLAQQLGIERSARAAVHRADISSAIRASLRTCGRRASSRASTATSRRCSAAASMAVRHQRGGRAAARGRRARCDQRADAGHGARISSSFAMIARARLDSSRKGSRRSSCCRFTTSWCSKFQARVARVRAELPLRMTGVATLSVPLVVDDRRRLNWEQAH